MPQLVPKHDLAAAVASNDVGINISTAIGPALGGVVIGGLGIAAPFWINALSNLALIGRCSSGGRRCRKEAGSGRSVLPAPWRRHGRFNPNLRATLNLLEAQLADMRPAVSTGYARGRFDPPPIERRKLM